MGREARGPRSRREGEPGAVLLGAVAGRPVAARLISGRVDDLLIAAAPDAPGPSAGEIWTARVDRLLSARAAERPGAFLHAGAARLFLIDARGVAPGDLLRVRVLREADPAAGKAATATRKIELPGRWLTLTPGAPGVNVSRKIADAEARARLVAAAQAATPALNGAAGAALGAVLRSRARAAESAEISAEAAALASDWTALEAAPLAPPRRLRAGPALAALALERWGDAAAAPSGRLGAEDPALAAAVAEALKPRAPLVVDGGGAWMALTRAAAAILVDVNAGAARSAEAVNLAAAAEIPRQLRLRGWSGAILVDFLGSGEQEQSRLERQLRARADGALEILGWGPLGLLEARRRDDRPSVETAFALDADGEPVAAASLSAAPSREGPLSEGR